MSKPDPSPDDLVGLWLDAATSLEDAAGEIAQHKKHITRLRAEMRKLRKKRNDLEEILFGLSEKDE